MENVYDIVEKIELIPSQSMEGKDLKKTWRSFRLLQGSEKAAPTLWGSREKETVLDPKGNIRVAIESVTVEWVAGEYDQSTLRAPFEESINFIDPSDSIEILRYDEKHFALICAELNNPIVRELEHELRALQRLPSDLANNSENRSSILFLRYVLYEISKWYEEQNIKPPVDLKKLLSISAPTPSVNPSPKYANTSQDSFVERFLQAASDFGRIKHKTIPTPILYDIGMRVCPKDMPKKKDFLPGSPMYRKLRKYASDAGYANRGGKK